MCGIYGFFHLDPEKKADPSLLTPMGESLRHRGPDDSGQMADRYAALGHRRLSIIDLSPDGRQPMANEDQTVWITFNGEIFNYRDFIDRLKAKGHVFRSRSDTEVILHLYEEMGIECLKKLHGMFSFVLWDKRRDEIFLVRDRLGIKPLHFAAAENQIIFASEIKALLRHPAVPRTLDLESLSRYLSFEYVPAPHCIFSGIRKVMPGHYLHVCQGDIRDVCYWSTADIEPSAKKKEEDYLEEFEGLLTKAVRLWLVSDVPVGAFLSGGIDSSTICYLMNLLSPGNVQSFNISFEEESFDESSHARLVAAHLGIRHNEERLSAQKMLAMVPSITDYLDEPFGDASFFPTLLLSSFTRRHVKVALSGDGSDELFAGYPTYLAHGWAPVYGRLPNFLRSPAEGIVKRLPVSHRDLSLDFKMKRFISAAAVLSPARRNYLWLGSFNPAEKNALWSAETARELRNFDAYEIAETYYGSRASPEELERILYCDQRFYLQDNMLVKVDRASMAASLEARVPFLDHEIVEFAARLPSHFKLRGFTSKYLLKKWMRGKLPQSILGRRKKGFGVPLARWFHHELKDFLREIFSEDAIRKAGLFNPAEISRLLEEHFSRRQDHRKKIYTLLNFELWRRKYLEGS